MMYEVYICVFHLKICVSLENLVTLGWGNEVREPLLAGKRLKDGVEHEAVAGVPMVRVEWTRGNLNYVMPKKVKNAVNVELAVKV